MSRQAPPSQWLPAARLLADTIATSNGSSLSQIREQCRLKSIVQVRRRIVRAMRKQGYSLPQIGRVIDRHHTTVLHLLTQEGYS